MEVQAALNYPTFYIPGTAITYLALRNSLLKGGYADFMSPPNPVWYGLLGKLETISPPNCQP